MPEKLSFYAFFMLIMLTFRYAFSYAENGTLCCKLCRHNAGKPTSSNLNLIQEHYESLLGSFFTFSLPQIKKKTGLKSIHAMMVDQSNAFCTLFEKVLNK